MCQHRQEQQKNRAEKTARGDEPACSRLTNTHRVAAPNGSQQTDLECSQHGAETSPCIMPDHQTGEKEKKKRETERERREKRGAMSEQLRASDVAAASFSCLATDSAFPGVGLTSTLQCV